MFRTIVGWLLLACLAAGSIALMRGGVYGFTLFVFCPILLGAASVPAFRPESAGKAAVLGGLVVTIGTFALLAVKLEGLLCLIMAAPLTMPLGALGGWLAYHALLSARSQGGVAAIVLVLPGSLTWDFRAVSPVYEVHTAVEIRATPEQVWKHVVTFSEIPEPREWFFRAGLAYPQRARIEGTGAGAVRYCVFSTGAFVEPIEIWQEPRILHFRVTENPPPMRELSPYSDLTPKHLHGYMESKAGEFRLTALSNGNTLLEGTTWYQHGLWPAEYWRWWSDPIIHRIHSRVLNHIRALAEQGNEEDH